MFSLDLDQLDGDLRRAASGPDEEYAVVLERALDACAADQVVSEQLNELELHSDLADVYDRMGRVEDALWHADVLVECGYACSPDPRCRRAEILMRHGRAGEAAPIWDEVLHDWPDDVWVFNKAGLGYGTIGEHDVALRWLTSGLELAIRTGDPERLVPQLRSLRAESVAALGKEPDELQTVEPVMPLRLPAGFSAVPPPIASQGLAGHRAGDVALAYAWLPADEFALIEQLWPDIATEDSVRDGGRLVGHGEYCRRLERTLREAADAGLRRLRVAALRRAAFDHWVAEEGRGGEDEAALRAGYAAELSRCGVDVAAWPPGRNERCWCGSGVKNKKCCAAAVRS